MGRLPVGPLVKKHFVPWENMDVGDIGENITLFINPPECDRAVVLPFSDIRDLGGAALTYLGKEDT